MASSYWTIGFGFLATIALTRLLETEVFGVFALATFFVQLLRLQPKLGVGYAFSQAKDTSGAAIGTFLVTDLILASMGLLLVLAATPILSSLGYSSIVVQVGVVLAFAAMMEGIVGIGATLLDNQMKFSQASLVQSLVFPVSYVPALWLAVNSAGVWSLVAQNVTYNALYLIGIWWAVRRRLPQVWQVRWTFSPTLARRFLAFGSTVGLGLMAGMLLTQLDNFLIGTFVGLTVLGFYDRAYRTAQWPSTLLGSLNARAAFFTYARLQGDIVRLEKTVTMMLWIITGVAVPLALVILIAAPDLLVLLYGDRWLPSAFFLRILVIYSVVRPLWENAGALFIAMGKPRLTTSFSVIQVVVLAAVGLPMTLIWGALGTIVAVGLAFAVGMGLIYRNMVREMSVNLGSELGTPVLISVLTIVGYLALNRLTGLNDLPLTTRLAFKVFYTVTFFSCLTLILQPKLTVQRLGYLQRLAGRPRT